MGVISNDLAQKEFKSAYLLYGSEAYLRNYYKGALKAALVASDDTLNYSYFEGTSTDVNEVVELLTTMPFMSEHRVVIVENSGWLSKAGSDSEPEEGKKSSSDKLGLLIDTIKALGEDTVIIFSDEKIDKRSRLFKAIQSKGAVEEFAEQTDEKLARWLMSQSKAVGKQLDSQTAYYLVTESGHDMLLLSNELDKLIGYCYERDVITRKDIDEVCTHQISNKIFDMISAIAMHRQKEALKLYYDLIALRESPFHILTLLVRQYTQMLAVKEGIGRSVPVAMLASKLGIQEWLAKKIADQTRNIGLSEIKKSLAACAAADEAIKTGNLIDSMSVELLIISCSM